MRFDVLWTNSRCGIDKDGKVNGQEQESSFEAQEKTDALVLI